MFLLLCLCGKMGENLEKKIKASWAQTLRSFIWVFDGYYMLLASVVVLAKVFKIVLNSQYFLKWTNANSMKIFGLLAGHPSRIPSIIDTYTKPNLVTLKGIWFPDSLGFLLTQTTSDDWWAVHKFSWGWHWSTFKNIGC